ncbi:MAG: efflux RND transporter permease subunit [Chloroflexi bacterium]|nr:efflux RND transporter permease subunit [Chloroflexota bacterium]
MNIANISIRQPVFIAMLMLALIVVGFIGYSRLPVDLIPNINIPYVFVMTVYPGASPDEVQREVSERLEEALGTLNGVKNVTSTSSENVSQVLVEYDLAFSAVRAAEDVREKVATVRGAFPADVQDPVIQRIDPAAAPILTFAVVEQTGKMPPDELRRLVENKIKPRLDRLDGVADINISGGWVRQIQIALNLDEMRLRRIAPQQIVSAIQTENLNLPGGRITDNGKDVLVRTPGNFKSVAEIGEIIVANPRGVPVYLKDVATVKDGFAEVVNYSRLNGKDTVAVSIIKQSGTNTVRVADEVKAELARVEKEFPDLALTVASDQSEFVKSSVEDSITDLILGGVFASLVVLLFFRDVRNTLVTVVGLPVIMIGTFAVMNALGLGLNMITLMALALAVGLVIDDAIVVRENIFRHMERGETPKEAASRGTNEVSLAVLAMTLTVLSVFLPVAFTTGFIGIFFREFGLTISIAVAISLVEAFTLAPMLSAYFFKQMKPKPGHAHEEGAASNLGWLDRFYRRGLAWALRHKIITALIGLLVFVSIFGLATLVEMAFFPSIDSDSFTARLQLKPGTPLAQTDAVARQIENSLKELPDVVDVFVSVGSTSAPEIANFTIKMRESGLLTKAEPEIRRRFANVAGLSFSFSDSFGEGGGGVTSRPILLNVKTTGSLEELDQASLAVMNAIADVPGLVDLDRTQQSGKPEMHIEVDRQRASRAGLSTASVGATVRTLINGQTASRYRESGREADIVVRLRPEDRSRLDDILSLAIPSASGQQVPLRNVASVSSSTGPTSIRRINRQPQIAVGANFVGRTQGAVVNDVRARVDKVTLPPGVTVSFGGETEMMAESFNSLLFSMFLSVIFVYMVLASQFGSFTQPLVLMLALPLSIIGAFMALLIAHFAFDMMAMIGLILLMGLVTKNSILLVDFTNRLRDQGMSRDEALLTAGPIRLRPILMTTLALILGMLPVALGLGAGGSFRASMAVAVIGGLITSTLLTLILVPVAYSIMDSILGRLRRRSKEPQPMPAPSPAAE